MLCDIQDYTRVSAGLCDMIYNTTLYGIQYQLLCYVVPVPVIVAVTVPVIVPVPVPEVVPEAWHNIQSITAIMY